MGQAMTSETLSISGGDGHRYWVGLQARPISRGAKKTVYKGVLLGSGPRQWEKVVGKSFTDMPGTRESWEHEVKKATMTKEMSIKFAGEYSPQYSIQVVIPGIVQMDKVSKVSSWQERRHGHRSLGKDDWISIEEFIPGQVHRFSPWYEEKDILESDHLQTFSHFTYKMTNGELVACDFQGIFEDAHFTFTDSIIHSRLQLYGRFDEGEYGITEFFKRHKCTKLCSEWPVPMLQTPPPPFEEVCGGPKHVRFDLTPYENIVFPSQRIKPKKQKKSTGFFFRRRASLHHISSKKLDGEEGQALVQNKEKESPQPLPLQSENTCITDTSEEIRPRTFSEGALELQKSQSVRVNPYHKIHIVLDDIPIPERSKMRSCLKRTLSDQRGVITAQNLPPLPLSKPLVREHRPTHHHRDKSPSDRSRRSPTLGNVKTTSGRTLDHYYYHSKSVHGHGHHKEKQNNESKSETKTRESSSKTKTSEATDKTKTSDASGKTKDEPSGKTKTSEASGKAKDEPSGKTKTSEATDKTKTSEASGKTKDEPSGKTKTSEASGKAKDEPSGKTKTSEASGKTKDEPSGKTKTSEASGKAKDEPSGKTKTSEISNKTKDEPSGQTKTSEASGKTKTSEASDKTKDEPCGKTKTSEAAAGKTTGNASSKTKSEPTGKTKTNEPSDKPKDEPSGKTKVESEQSSKAASSDVGKASQSGASLLQRRLSRDKGDNSDSASATPEISEFTINLPRLEPTAPPLIE